MLTWGDWHGFWNMNIRFYLDPTKAKFIPIPTDSSWVTELDKNSLLKIINDLHPMYYRLFQLSTFKDSFTTALTNLGRLIENIEQQWKEECSFFGDTCLDEEKLRLIMNNYTFLTKKETFRLLFNTEEHNNENRFYRQIRTDYHLIANGLNANKQTLVSMIPKHIHVRIYSDGELHLFNYAPYAVIAIRAFHTG